MNRSHTKRGRVRQQRMASRNMMIAFAAVLFVGMFLQIAMIARLAGKNKQIQAVENEITDLKAYASNLSLSLSQFQSLDRVTLQAEKLGMGKPTEAQIRVVSVPEIIDDTSAQSAGNAGAGNP